MSLKIKNYFWLVLLVLISLFPLLDLFRPGMFLSHDGQDHVARIANFYQSLSEGNLIPRWAANLNWGYGHPILMFLYPLPSYLASLFHFLGLSFVDSVKLVFGVTYVLSGLTMYLWIRELLGEKAGFISGIFYMFAPYRFIDLYVRGAIGEHVFFVFPPLVLYFLLKLSQEVKWHYIMGGSMSLAGLLLSHNALSLMFLPVIFIYGVFLLWQSRIKKLLGTYYLLLITYAFTLSAFFWLPAFFEGRYTLRDIVTAGDYSSRFISLQNLFYSPWSFGGTGEFSTQLGLTQWSAVFFGFGTIAYLFNKKNPYWVLGGIFLIFFLTSLFFMTSSSLFFWQKFPILQKFQFPWRFLSLAIFPPAVLAGLLVSFLRGKRQVLTLLLLSFLVLWLNSGFWHARGFFEKPGIFYTGIYSGTTDTGESSPRWSVRFMENPPSESLAVIDGEAVVEQKKRLSNAHLYNVDAKAKTRFVENTLYFPGWEILIYNEQGKPVNSGKLNIEFQDPNFRGLQTFYVEPGKYWILVHFVETKLRKFADMVSLLAILALFTPFVFRRKQGKLGVAGEN
ncbi:MAG: 6-pyruvoyl-tetrahydropterin synthase-related protein [bacterium]|nr:6-pyruvoyl-tetrahydropterin synthase-related protein [bacterium]